VVVIDLGAGRMVGGSLCGWGMAWRRVRHKGALQERSSNDDGGACEGGARQRETMWAGCREIRGRGQKAGVDRVVKVSMGALAGEQGLGREESCVDDHKRLGSHQEKSRWSEGE
jgi:hypothetical protein